MTANFFLTALLGTSLLLTSALSPSPLYGEEREEEKEKNVEESKGAIMMQEVTVEGELDKPAIFFIPKAQLFKKDLFEKSFYNDIIEKIDIHKFFLEKEQIVQKTSPPLSEKSKKIER